MPSPVSAPVVESYAATLLRSEISHIECFTLELGLAKPMIMSTYSLTAAPVLYVRVCARNGLEGWGEAAANAIMSGETLQGMVAAFEQFVQPVLLGSRALNRRALMAQLRKAVYANSGLLAAVDMALLDLSGKLLNIPVVEMLGGAQRRAVTALRLIGGSGCMQTDITQALELRQQGYKAFKLKVGVAALEQEVETVLALRKELGTDSLVCADANMGWTPGQTLEFLRATTEAKLAFLEQPLSVECLPQLKRIASHTSVPLCIDESLHDEGDLLAHVRENAISGASLKSIKLGGIASLVRTGNLCSSLGLSINIAMMMESGLATAAMVHAACAVEAIDWGLSLGQLWLSTSPVAGVEICEGNAICPELPGLGVNVDISRLQPFLS